jgi:quinol monooxygenase YgiN
VPQGLAADPEGSGGMYARSSTIRGNPERLDAGIAYVRDKVMPAVGQMDGCVGLSMLCEREFGRCIVTTAWADSEALRRSADAIKALRLKAAEIMQGESEVDEWEIAVMHRAHDTREGACARVVWSRCDPARMDSMIDTYRMGMLPRVEELPGFCSVSMMVDRAGGRVVRASIYDDRDDMIRTQEQAMDLRRAFHRQTGMEATEVAEFDVVLAHLRVPETV